MIQTAKVHRKVHWDEIQQKYHWKHIEISDDFSL